MTVKFVSDDFKPKAGDAMWIVKKQSVKLHLTKEQWKKAVDWNFNVDWYFKFNPKKKEGK